MAWPWSSKKKKEADRMREEFAQKIANDLANNGPLAQMLGKEGAKVAEEAFVQASLCFDIVCAKCGKWTGSADSREGAEQSAQQKMGIYMRCDCGSTQYLVVKR
jgi:hypothetical protein